jgi:hypothetical protein
VARAPDQQRLAETTAAILSASRALRLGLQVMILGLGAYYVLQRKLTPGAMIAASIILGRPLGPDRALDRGLAQLRLGPRRLAQPRGFAWRLRCFELDISQRRGNRVHTLQRISFALKCASETSNR